MSSFRGVSCSLTRTTVFLWGHGEFADGQESSALQALTLEAPWWLAAVWLISPAPSLLA